MPKIEMPKNAGGLFALCNVFRVVVVMDLPDYQYALPTKSEELVVILWQKHHRLGEKLISNINKRSEYLQALQYHSFWNLELRKIPKEQDRST